MSGRKIPVAILGATGTVGQKLIRRLDGHPWFEVVHLTASPGNAGRRFAEATRWREPTPIPPRLADLELAPSDRPVDVPLAFSAVDTDSAATVEPAWAAAGAMVVTNASPARLAPDVPLLIPEVNAEHLALLAEQRRQRGWRGGLVANPNCTTTGLVLALAPLDRAFGVDRVFVSTFQAVSGAGWPGVASLDVVGNVVPHIAQEEEKVERESRKLLGSVSAAGVTEATIRLSVHANRVPVIDGHLATVSVGFRRAAPIDRVAAELAGWRPESARGLPSSPANPVVVTDLADRPQPRLDLDRGDGMTVTVGRIRPCPLLGVRLVLLVHNTVRGAAGATIQNAELLVREGLVAR